MRAPPVVIVLNTRIQAPFHLHSPLRAGGIPCSASSQVSRQIAQDGDRVCFRQAFEAMRELGTRSRLHECDRKRYWLGRMGGGKPPSRIAPASIYAEYMQIHWIRAWWRCEARLHRSTKRSPDGCHKGEGRGFACLTKMSYVVMPLILDATAPVGRQRGVYLAWIRQPQPTHQVHELLLTFGQPARAYVLRVRVRRRQCRKLAQLARRSEGGGVACEHALTTERAKCHPATHARRQPVCQVGGGQKEKRGSEAGETGGLAEACEQRGTRQDSSDGSRPRWRGTWD